MNIAIIGGSGHYNFVFEALALRPELRLCAVAPADGDEDISGLLAACRAHGLTPQRHDSAAALLDAHPEIELAAVNPWFSRAADVSIACLKRGVHVFSEKPLATRLDKLDELENVWRKSGRGLGGMFNLRYCGWFKTVQRAIAEGKIGVVRQIQGRKSYKMGNRPEFYRRRETFGGVIPWVGIHALDWATQIGGACVYSAALTNADYNRGHGDMEVTSAVLMELQNGVIATVTADFLRPDGAPRHDDDRLRVTGTAGTLYAYDGQVWLEDAAGRRALPIEESEQCLLNLIDALGTPAAIARAQTDLAVTRTALSSAESHTASRVQPDSAPLGGDRSAVSSPLRALQPDSSALGGASSLDVSAH